jgi:hypothetical protein
MSPDDLLMTPRPDKQARLDLEAHKRLAKLKSELQSEGLPRRIDSKDLLSALVFFTPPQQAAGMLNAYWRYTAESD